MRTALAKVGHRFYYLYQGSEIPSPSSCDFVCPVFLHPCLGPEDTEAGLEEERPFPAYSGPGWLHLVLHAAMKSLQVLETGPKMRVVSHLPPPCSKGRDCP